MRARRQSQPLLQPGRWGERRRRLHRRGEPDRQACVLRPEGKGLSPARRQPLSAGVRAGVVEGSHGKLSPPASGTFPSTAWSSRPLEWRRALLSGRFGRCCGDVGHGARGAARLRGGVSGPGGRVHGTALGSHRPPVPALQLCGLVASHTVGAPELSQGLLLIIIAALVWRQLTRGEQVSCPLS